MANSVSKNRISRAETALLLGISLLFFVYGMAQWTNTITYTPPPFAYFLAGILALLWSVSLHRRT
ncbi:hypothetical protein, partial [Haloarcula mannanilytica]|uniref:hypothetical protein n=1 Tax=Haloarcula mannanilytica TaxID=2509225 RepID=UPI001F25A5BF